MPIQCLTPILNVSSIAESFAWFELLGWKRGFSWNSGGMIPCAAVESAHGPATFGSVGSGKAEIFLCVGAQGSRGERPPQFPGDENTDGVWMSWFFDSLAEVDALHRLAIEHHMTIASPPEDKPWGMREFHLRHPDGHTFRIGSGLDHH